MEVVNTGVNIGPSLLPDTIWSDLKHSGESFNTYIQIRGENFYTLVNCLWLIELKSRSRLCFRSYPIEVKLVGQSNRIFLDDPLFF